MCTQCEVLSINGALSHEIGCPKSWKEETRHCAWCGQLFTPAHKHEYCCCEDCKMAFYNEDIPDEDFNN